jgi:hypothetical protein
MILNNVQCVRFMFKQFRQIMLVSRILSTSRFMTDQRTLIHGPDSVIIVIVKLNLNTCPVETYHNSRTD